MSKNILQVYQDNPIVTNQSTDLMYFGRAPYGLGDDTAMQFSDFATQFGASYTPSPLTKVDDANVTVTLTGTPATALLQSVTMTLGWTGLLAIARGGTGVGSVTIVPTATAFAGWDANSNLSANNFLAGTALVTNSGGTTILTVASAGQQIFSGGTFQTVQMPVVATLATGQSYRLINDSSNALFVVSSGSNAIVTMQPLTQALLTYNGVAGTAAASWDVQYTSNTIGVQSITGTLNRITSTGGTTPVIDIDATYIGQTSITTLGTITTGIWEGTDVGIAYGGTGVSSVTTAPTAIAFAGWDASLNMSANNFLGGFATTVSAAGTTTLTVASAYNQEITGATTQTVQMPVTSTLVAGHPFKIINNSSGAVTLNSSGGNAILVMAANTVAFVTCVLASGTTAASWNASYVFDNGAAVLSITGTANQVIASASTGAVTLSLPQSIATTSDVTFGSVAFSPNTKGIVGTPTNDSAGTGYVGEVVSSSVAFASRVSLANGVAANITSISLTAGDWDVYGNVVFTPAVGTVLLYNTVWTSVTSATLPDNSNYSGDTYGAGLTAAATYAGYDAPVIRLSLSGTTTVYLSCQAGFTTSVNAACGNILARRRR